MKYYIYRHIRLDLNIPFYIGKGSGKRAFNFKNNRNKYHQHITNKFGCSVQIIKYFDNEQKAFDFEKTMIKLYKSLGYCKANFTDGGEGISGYNHTKETKLKMSKNKIGKVSPRKGQTHSLKSKLKMSKSKKGLKMHINTKNALLKSNTGRTGTMLGRYHKESSKKLMSEKHKDGNNSASKKIICLDTKTIFMTLKDCANYLNISYSTLFRHLNGQVKNKKYNMEYYNGC